MYPKLIFHTRLSGSGILKKCYRILSSQKKCSLYQFSFEIEEWTCLSRKFICYSEEIQCWHFKPGFMKSSLSAQRKQAIILGGSFAGLITAKVLSRYYKHVLIIEKDSIHHYPESRKGQPHTKHLHGLLPRGLHILCDYFPGLFEEIVDHGSVTPFLRSLRCAGHP